MKKLTLGPVEIEFYQGTTVIKYLGKMWTYDELGEEAAIHTAHSLLVDQTDKFMTAAKEHGYDLADEQDGGTF